MHAFTIRLTNCTETKGYTDGLTPAPRLPRLARDSRSMIQRREQPTPSPPHLPSPNTPFELLVTRHLPQQELLRAAFWVLHHIENRHLKEDESSFSRCTSPRGWRADICRRLRHDTYMLIHQAEPITRAKRLRHNDNILETNMIHALLRCPPPPCTCNSCLSPSCLHIWEKSSPSPFDVFRILS